MAENTTRKGPKSQEEDTAPRAGARSMGVAVQAGARPSLRAGRPCAGPLAPRPQRPCLWTEHEHTTSLGMARGAHHGPRTRTSAGARTAVLTAEGTSAAVHVAQATRPEPPARRRCRLCAPEARLCLGPGWGGGAGRRDPQTLLALAVQENPSSETGVKVLKPRTVTGFQAAIFRHSHTEPCVRPSAWWG